LISQNPADHDLARDQVAALLTQNNGEYVLRIGEQPPHAELFSGDLTDETVNWTGTPQTAAEIEVLRERLSRAVEEVGGKVC